MTPPAGRASPAPDRAPGAATPSALPRPPGELEALVAAWRPPTGWRVLSAVNNMQVGLLYVGAALGFLAIGGILALLIRAQLAVPGNTLLGPEAYNQVFTMHGSVMMFLFAVPVVEAAAVYLLPGMLGARDLPFPRLSAYAFWAYAAGGLAFCASLLGGLAPDGGWFMYPPLTGTRFSPGLNAEFWLLGIGFIEVSAIASAVELIVGILRTRAPGMTLGRMPIFAWAMLAVAWMVVFAFPPLIVGTLLLELERAFGWPFFVPEHGGDPLLWQHLFWFFGHPDVYIIFLPAAGMLSTIVPVMAGVPLAGYGLVVAALIGMAGISFLLWVHHMFTAGLSVHWMHVFSAASLAVVLPSGMQVFAWLATIRRGRLRLTTPTLFVLGFFAVFTTGGLTGVMLALLPFDWQAHDTHFVVAHLHYVLIGGMLFPLLAGLYYWAPTVSGHGLSDRLGRWVCGLLFAGVNVAFLPMHLTGLLGMPRRVYTYPAGLGWEWPNLVSSAGAALIALAMLLLAVDLVRHVRPASSVDVDPWRAATLEWLPLGPYGPRSIPRVESRHPLWDQPGLREEVAAGAHYLPGTITGGRETLVTSPAAARPQYVAVLPGDGWPPFLAAIATAAFFLLLTVAQPLPAAAAGAFALVMILVWMWQTDRGPGSGPVDVGGGLRLPMNASGPASHAWWAMGVLLVVAATSFASLVFSYVYLARGAHDGWPPAGQSLPAWEWPAAAAAAWAAVSAALAAASRALGRARAAWFRALVSVAAFLAVAAVGLELAAQLRAGLAPQRHAYGATVAAIASVQACSAAAVVAMALYSLARSWCGRLARDRRLTFDMTMLAGHYVAAQGVAGLAVVHLGPRLF